MTLGHMIHDLGHQNLTLGYLLSNLKSQTLSIKKQNVYNFKITRIGIYMYIIINSSKYTTNIQITHNINNE